MKLRASILCLLSLILLLPSCKHTEEPTPYEIDIPYGFPTRLNIPDDNPMTVEGVALGKCLFEDGHLSGYSGTEPDSLMSCADCHKRAHNYDIGTDDPRFPGGKPHGRTGIYTRHTAMPLCNLIFNHEGYLWNGAVSYQQGAGAQNIEDIVKAAILAEDEIAGTEARTLAALRKDSRYPEMFKKAFGSEEITMDRIQKAIAQYVRSLISGNSKFDRYLQGMEQLTPQELHGYILFTTEEGADCFHCHGSGGSPLFTTNLFYNNGLDATFTDDRGAYRAPSLRNITASAPYMHDGRFQTLNEVLAFYNEGLQYSPYVSPLMHKLNEGGRHLTPNDIADLEAFLRTLTDEEFLYGTR